MQVAAVLAWCLAPVYWLLASSFREPGEVFSLTPVPVPFTFQNYRTVLEPSTLLTAGLVNSAIIASTVTAVVLAVGTSGAYAFVRLRFAGSGVASGAMLAISLLPAVMLVTPFFVISTDVHWSGTLLAVIVPDIAVALPLAVYTLASFLRALPWELEEAALVDGCGRFRAFVAVMAPLAAPSVLTVGVITFVSTWNEYLIASALTTESSIPVTVVVGDFAAQLTGQAAASAASVIATAPVVVLVLLAQRRIIAGLTAGAVQG